MPLLPTQSPHCRPFKNFNDAFIDNSFTAL